MGRLTNKEAFDMLFEEMLEDVSWEAHQEGEKWRSSVKELIALLLKTYNKNKKTTL